VILAGFICLVFLMLVLVGALCRAAAAGDRMIEQALSVADATLAPLHDLTDAQVTEAMRDGRCQVYEVPQRAGPERAA
jgi:hypothetical protein